MVEFDPDTINSNLLEDKLNSKYMEYDVQESTVVSDRKSSGDTYMLTPDDLL